MLPVNHFKLQEWHDKSMLVFTILTYSLVLLKTNGFILHAIQCELQYYLSAFHELWCGTGGAPS